MGVGAIIGTGIFVVIGEGAGIAGPAVILVLRPGGRGVCVLRAVLRGTGVVDPGLRQRLHVHLRDPRRDRRLDHRLGPDPGVRRLGRRRGGRLGRQTSTPSWTRPSASQLPEAISQRPPEDGGVFNLPAVLVVLAITAAAGARRRGRAPGSTWSWSCVKLAGADLLHRRRVDGVQHARTSPRSPPSGVGGASPRPRRSSSSRTSASTRSPPAARRPRNPRATCRWRSSARWSSARSSTCSPRSARSASPRPSSSRASEAPLADGARRGRGHQLGGRRAGARRAGRDHQRDPGDPVRPDPDLLRHVPRRPDAGAAGQGEPAVRHSGPADASASAC